jgi:hypothetical protein
MTAKTYEYHEGKQAQADFEKGMKALFQVPKDAVPVKKNNKKQKGKYDNPAKNTDSAKRHSGN